MLQNEENNGAEEIGLVTPTPVQWHSPESNFTAMPNSDCSI